MTSTVRVRPTAPRRAAPSRRPVLAPNVALTLVALGALAVLGLWWQDTQFVYGLGSWLTNAGRITGLLCGYAVVVLLALMARVPALEHGVGSDRLTRWHAMGGRYTVSLAIAHTLLIIWGYAVSANTGVVHETGTLLLTYPDVLMATVALGLLVMVGAVSARAARRRMRYETWHLLHLYTYLAIALAFAHQFATGADFVDQRVRWLWSAMYVLVGALLLWYRVLTPLVALWRHQLRVIAVHRHNHEVVSIVLAGRDVARLSAEPGQFFRWRFLTRGLWWAANPYSLSAAPRGEHLRITVKVAGAHSAALARLRPGVRVLAEGPYGAFTDRTRTAAKVLLIGIGIGITPIRALLESIPAAPGAITLLYRARDPEDLVLADEIDEIARARGARVHFLVGRRRASTDADHLSLAHLRRLVPDLAAHEVWLCGPDGLAARIVRTLRRAGIPSRRIHHESFTF
jgi:predicted ferric reductase